MKMKILWLIVVMSISRLVKNHSSIVPHLCKITHTHIHCYGNGCVCLMFCCVNLFGEKLEDMKHKPNNTHIQVFGKILSITHQNPNVPSPTGYVS